jgi:FtsZ-binding cell division protein ZapB
MSQMQGYLFKAISGYFVNFYFKTLYNSAKSASISSREGLSITDMYRSKVSSYIQAIKSVEDAYKQLVNGLHKYCTKISTRFNSITFSQFVDTLVDGFVPVDYNESLSTNDKDEIFSVVILDLAATLGTVCTRPEYLRKIIDQHEDARNITCEMMFKEAMRCLDNKRDMLMNKFIREVSQAKDYISADAANSLREMLDQKEEIIEARNEEIAGIRYEIEELREKESKLRRMVQLLQQNRVVIQRDVAPVSSYIEVPVPVPLTAGNLVSHTISQKHDRRSRRSENIMGSIVSGQKLIEKKPRTKPETPPPLPIQEIPAHEPESEHQEKVQEPSGTESYEESEESESMDESLSSGKKSVMDNIDGLLFTQ